MKFSRLIPAAIILAGLALGTVIDRHFPTTQEVFARPFTHAADVGETVALRSADVTVTDVHAAHRVQWFGTEYATTGTWVVVDVEMVAKGEPFFPHGWRLHSPQGFSYGGDGDVGSTCPSAQAGVPQVCRAAFEVNSGDVSGLTLLIPASADPAAPGDDLAEVALGEGWAAQPADLLPLDPPEGGGA